MFKKNYLLSLTSLSFLCFTTFAAEEGYLTEFRTYLTGLKDTPVMSLPEEAFRADRNIETWREKENALERDIHRPGDARLTSTERAAGLAPFRFAMQEGDNPQITVGQAGSAGFLATLIGTTVGGGVYTLADTVPGRKVCKAAGLTPTSAAVAVATLSGLYQVQRDLGNAWTSQFVAGSITETVIEPAHKALQETTTQLRATTGGDLGNQLAQYLEAQVDLPEQTALINRLRRFPGDIDQHIKVTEILKRDQANTMKLKKCLQEHGDTYRFDGMAEEQSAETTLTALEARLEKSNRLVSAINSSKVRPSGEAYNLLREAAARRERQGQSTLSELLGHLPAMTSFLTVAAPVATMALAAYKSRTDLLLVEKIQR